MTSSPPDAASGYSHGHQPAVLASHGARTAASSCGYLLPHLAPGMRLLDVGWGPGSITCDLAELLGPEGRVVGVDFSPEAIAAAQSLVESRGDRRTRFVLGDLLTLDEEPASFDVVHAHQVLQHVADPVGALRSMAALLRPGGIIAVRDADYGAMSWYPEAPGLDRWREVYTTSARADGGEPDAGRRLRSWVQLAGLEIRSIGASTWTYATPAACSWWGDSQAARVLTSNFAGRALAAGLSADELNQIAAGWRAWGASPDAWFLMPHGEVIATRP